MDFIAVALALLGLYVGVKVVMKIGGWLVNWARRAIRAMMDGLRSGVLTLAKGQGEVQAYALGAPQGGELEVVDEITVDQDELDEEVLQALRRHGAVSERIYV
jgi:hypothetical protein